MQTVHFLSTSEIRVRFVPLPCLSPLVIFNDRFKEVLVITCWEGADLLALLFVMFSCVFVTFSHGVLHQVWYLVLSILNLCSVSLIIF